MASNRRRSLRKLSNYVNRIDRDVRNMSKRQFVTKLGDRTVGTPQLAEGAVTSDILDSEITTDIETAITDAATAISTADGKNTIYRQTSQPTGGTYADGDLWFDSDDDNKLYRYSSSPSPAWTSFTLGNNALSNLSANKITAGTLDASLITVSNLNAGSITSGTLSGLSIFGGTIDIGGNDASSFHVDSSGNMWVGASTYASAPFRVSAAGAVFASSAFFGNDWNIVGNDLRAGTSFVGHMQLGPTASALGTPAFYISGPDNAEAYVSADQIEVNDGVTQTILYPDTVLVNDGTTSSSLTKTTLTTTTVNATNMGNPGTSTNWQGIGIRYFDASHGPGTHNAMALQWDGTAAFAVIDNVAGQYLGGAVFSDRRIKINIAEPSDEWSNKLLNEVKIWQFDKINPLNEDDLHVYRGHIGVIADEFKQIFPQFESSNLLADPDGEDAHWIRSVDYTFMIPSLLLIAQKFDARLKEIEDRLGV